MELFRVRLNCIDHYQSPPTKYDPILTNNVRPSQIQNEPKVPVIRVFGATETGQKVCAHIHGAFPYLYIDYVGNLGPHEVGAYIHRLHLSIDYALAVSYRRNMSDGNAKFVARITLVKGVPFYGFHVGYRYYLKIYMLNPMVLTRLADLLRQGAVMKQFFQPYEAHLQYLLQWMTDYNLYGCGYIDCSSVSFRSPVPDYDEMDNPAHLWHSRSIPGELVTNEAFLPRVSHCSIEIDICVQDILNRRDIKPRSLHHDFIERINPLPADERLVNSMAGLWKDETRRRRLRMSSSDTSSSPFPAEVMVSMSADPRNSQPGGWIHEEEYRERILDLIEDEKIKSGAVPPTFGNFVKPSSIDATVRTTLEAVEDLYPKNLRVVLGLEPKTAIGRMDIALGNKEVPAVDEKRIFKSEMDYLGELLYDSDEEVMREMARSQKNFEDQIKGNPLSKVSPLKSESSVALNMIPGQPSEDVDASKSDMLSLQVSSKIRPNEGMTGDGMESLAQDSYDAVRGLVKGDELSDDHSPWNGLDPMETVQKRLKHYAAEPSRDSKRRKMLARKRENKSEPMDTVVEADHLIMSTPESHILVAQELESVRENRHTAHRSTLVNETSENLANVTPKKLHQELTFGRERSQTQTLPFPVVKDPHDPNTILRLSQKSVSEQSPTTKNKHVSFQDSDSQVSGNKSNPTTAHSPSVDSSDLDWPNALPDVINDMRIKFSTSTRGIVLAYASAPPLSQDVISTMQEYNLPQVIYQDAFYGNELDVPERPREWAGKEFKLESLTVPFLSPFDPTGRSGTAYGRKSGFVPDRVKEEKKYLRQRRACHLKSWEIAEPPPTRKELVQWLEEERQAGASSKDKIADASSTVAQNHEPKNKLSQLDGPTQKNNHGFKYTQHPKTRNIQFEADYMSTMSLEVHVNTRGNLVPNPELDEVQCLFWCLQSEDEGLQTNGVSSGTHLGIVVLSEDGLVAQKISRQTPVDIREESSELDILIRMVEIVRALDPDILTGYEVHGGSWGYLIERARLKYDYNLCDELSRMKAQSFGRFGKDNDKWGFNNTSTIRVTGRHMINIWRAMRSELNLLQYTMENVAFHLLHRRVPHYTWADLTSWYTNNKPRDLAKVVDHYISRVQLDLEILEQNELIARTSEQARLLGVDFFSVFSRGSQFKVESLMFRIAKAENFLLVSPSRKQVGGQNALECLPLVMEPQSAFYTSPVLVLDFQSLYPSIMIAYNYCYSTFLGRIVNWRGTNKMGFIEYERQERLLELLKDHINIAPNGMMYTRPEIRKSLLAKMLVEILETRVMVKSGMKIDKDDKALQRLLNNRQLALKLIANVTYGYTSASFSGRMPCSEIADSIVQTARETLERAIALIHSVKRWNAEVVYGDTDSLFVHLKGRTRDQAFDIGEEIAKTVTNMNPRPVKLKFEKVYHPCVLLTKKRYVGFKYESRKQTQPEFDAKGIETVRRDGTPAEQKIEETALKILFRTSDLSQVKSYFQKQCEKIMKGSVSIQDFCFAREVKLGTYSDKGPPPPGVLISTRKMLEDARAEPQYGERVPYVVITGAPGARLIDRCVAPEELLESDHHELDAEYYISKNLIPPLERIFNLTGANVRNWYDEMPKVQRIRRVDANLQIRGQSKEAAAAKKTLESYMKSSSCLVCKEKLKSSGAICPQCIADMPSSIFSLRTRLSKAEKTFLDLQKICQSCSGISPLDEVRCDSKDCPVFYTRTRQKARLRTEKSIVEPVLEELSRMRLDPVDLDW